MKFYLGSHRPNWLGTSDVPLFVSHRQLLGGNRPRKSLPVAKGPWALDSGAFTELKDFGGWRTTPEAYTAAVTRYRDEVGQLAWAAPQDWMCEPKMLAKTGLSVAEHQARTVGNYVDLRATGLPVIPVLQGWTGADYDRCFDFYERAGVDLTAEPLVGLGSVCRRQSTSAIEAIVAHLHVRGVKLHGFGVKTDGLRRYAWALTSADSMAWSYAGRRRGRRPGHEHRAKNCANCLPWALEWRQSVLDAISRPQQLSTGVAA